MDYEKKYNEALERAKELIALLDKVKLQATQADIYEIFPELLPELRESEDERIRRSLIGLVEQFMAGERKEKTLAWLEKLKEPVPIPDKFSGLKSLMLQYLQSAANRKDDSEIESDTDLWGRKILDYVWKYSDEQKEQKPVDNEKVEIVEMTDFEQSVYDLCPVLGIEEAKATASDLLELAKKTLLKTGKVVLASNYPEGCSFEDGFHLRYNEGFNAKQKEQKQQMLKDAVEGEVVKDISNKLAVTAKINLDGFKFGDKVHIIVLPKEE